MKEAFGAGSKGRLVNFDQAIVLLPPAQFPRMYSSYHLLDCYNGNYACRSDPPLRFYSILLLSSARNYCHPEFAPKRAPLNLDRSGDYGQFVAIRDRKIALIICHATSDGVFQAKSGNKSRRGLCLTEFHQKTRWDGHAGARRRAGLFVTAGRGIPLLIRCRLRNRRFLTQILIVKPDRCPFRAHLCRASRRGR
jgi:hypothetical protein